MKRSILIFSLLLIMSTLDAQKYMTKDGFISIYSHTPLEEIKAENNQVAGALDIGTGEMVFQVLIKSFHFERALMEEHFNENYMESDKFPKAIFKGKITNLSSLDLKKKGSNNVNVEGDLTIHGVTKKISVPGTMENSDAGIVAKSEFNLVPEDFNISIPGVVRDKINKTLAVNVIMKYTPVNEQK